MSLFDKAKEKLTANKDKVESGLDKAGEKAKQRFSGHSDKIDQGISKAKDALNRDSTSQQPLPQQTPQSPPTQP